MEHFLVLAVVTAFILPTSQAVFDCSGKMDYFYKDDVSCTKYYECRYGQLAGTYSCSLGYFFSQDSVGCIPATRLIEDGVCTLHGYRAGMAPEGPFICPRAGMFAVAKNCSLYNFCSRADVEGKTLQCPEQFFFNETMGSCRWRGHFKDCLRDGTRITSTPPPTTTPKPTQWNPWRRTTKRITTTRAPTTTGKPCFKEGLKTVDTEDCRGFYICNDLVWVRYQCPPLLMYNNKTGVCQWDVKVDTCDKGKFIWPTTTTTTTTVTSTTTQGYRAGMAPEGPFICPRAGFFAVPKNCSLYNYCYRANVEGKTLQCPEQFFFNETALSCRWPGHFKDCLRDGTRIAAIQPPTTTPRPTQWNPWRRTTKRITTTRAPTTRGKPCFKEGLKTVDTKDCRGFYICNDLVWVRYQCPPLLMFNNKTGVCQWNVKVDTCDKGKFIWTTTTTTTTVAPVTTQESKTHTTTKKETIVDISGKTNNLEIHQQTRAPYVKMSHSEIHCSANTIMVAIAREAVGPLEGDVHFVAHLRDPQCTGKDNSSHILFTFSLDTCGTSARLTKAFVVFENEIFIKNRFLAEQQVSVSFENYFNTVPVVCNYDRKELLSISYKPHFRTMNVLEHGFGHLTFSLEQYHGVQFKVPYQPDDYPLSVDLKDQIYIRLGVRLAAANVSGLALRADSCKATSSLSPFSSEAVKLIDDGCPAMKQLTVYPSNDPTEVLFGFPAFYFVRDIEKIQEMPRALLSCAALLYALQH
ncbi:uncharacterized protein LOC106169043 isoform X2 [Lingula anatina]|uniref:Uncharacterized protein LOC106169043 isoform X2 n=1 Tax=Lingula anatina TaxID=7574 RepID=A0A1S3J0K2_LINAN|nr:uncharacterized protein LOC106169043 isoform X2 [Lingula anatina]|eukprot:XP_013403788.1 uncharacterized protein LOC106169043 isoform X2 [Lingula anatina]